MFVLAFIAIVLAGLVASLTGFGFAILSVPLLMLFMPPKVVVPLAMMLSVVLKVTLIIETRRWIDLRRMWPLLLTGTLTVPLGAYVLLLLDAETLRILVGLVVVASAIALLSGMHWKVRNEKLSLVPLGLMSGILGGSTGMPGPPVVLFFSNQGLEKETFRANLVLYFACTGIMGVISTAVGGLITRAIVVNWLGLLPALGIGIWAGIRLARHTDQDRFRRVVLGVLILTGILAIISGLGLL
jgi:uncharacterized membrane protein YfcA